MSDLMRRMDAVQACQVGPSDEWSQSTKSGYNQAATDCAMNILRIPAVQPDAREAALREALYGLRKAADDLDGYVGRGYGDEYLELADRLALLDRPAHVNETQKSEHETRDMLTPATKWSHP